MSDETGAAAAVGDERGETIRTDKGELDPGFLANIVAAIEAEDPRRLSALVGRLHESDLGEVIGELDSDHRPALVRLLGDEFDWIALTEVDDTVREEILETVPNEQIAEGIRDLDSDDAIAILSDLEEEDRQEVFAGLPLAERIALQRSLDYPEDTAGRLMTNRFIAVPPFWTVGQTIDFMREDDRLPEEFAELYVVDPRYCFIGTVPLDRLLRSKRPVKVGDIVGEVTHSAKAEDDQEDVARLFQRYNLLSVGVVDDNGRLLGVITHDDIMDVIEEEADEDIRRLGGVGDEEISDSVAYSVKSRFVWLMFNLFTAAGSAAVIAFFDATIEQMVALAVLMPIVASLGGNVATQAMTVTVRAVATRSLGGRQKLRFTGREAIVGLVNGAIFATLVGVASAVFFANPQLGVVIAAAMIINMFVAGLAGAMIPLGLHRLGADPAVASSVFVTAVTDVLGFYAFLGLAAWWFGLG